MAIIRRSGGIGIKVDIDEAMIKSAIDTNLSDYLKIVTADAAGFVTYQAKAGDHRFADVDDSDASDIFQITCDDADGGVKQLTSQITDGAIWEIEPSGVYSGASATVDLDYLLLDVDGTTINDAATHAITLNGIKIDYNGATLTAITLSTIRGLYIDMPSGLGVAGKTIEGAYIKDGEGNIAHIANGSVAISATGINEEKYYWCEDFDEEAAAVTLAAGLRGDEWVRGGVNDADANTTYIQDQGGVLDIVTNGLDDDSHEITHLSTAINTTSNPILEFRVSVDSIAASITGFFVGVTETPDIQTINDISAVSDDYFVVGMNSDLGTPADLRAWGEDDNGGQVLTQLTGTAIAAATWCTIRMDLTDTEQPRVWVNATGGAITPAHEIDASLITQTVQAGIYVYPVIFVQCLDVTPTARHLLVDYVKVWQDRS